MKKLKKDYLIFFVIFVFSIIMYINWLSMHYASDTYNIMNVGYETYATNWSLKDGRLIMYLITMIFAKLNLPIEIFVIVTLLVAILISCICVIKLKNIIIENIELNIKKEIILVLAVFFTIFNFMYIEDMYFVESVVMALSILLLTYSADFIVNARSIGSRIKALTLAIIAVIAYQGTIGFIIILTFTISLLKNKIELEGKKDIIKANLRRIIMDSLISVLFAFIAICLNLLIVKIIGELTGQVQTRIGTVSEIFNNLEYILKNFNSILKDNVGLFPVNLLYTFLLISLIVSLIYDIKTKSRRFLTLKLVCIIIISIISAFIVSIGTLSSFYTGRLHYCIGSMMGFVLICLIIENKDEFFGKIFNLILIIYGIISICNCIIVTYQHKKVNEYEKLEVKSLNRYIEEYEEDSNIKVQNIAIYTIRGQSNKTYFADISRKSVVTYNALRCNWSADGLINFYTKRNLETINLNTNLLEEYIMQKNEKGYGIVNNTLIVECYMY